MRPLFVVLALCTLTTSSLAMDPRSLERIFLKAAQDTGDASVVQAVATIKDARLFTSIAAQLGELAGENLPANPTPTTKITQAQADQIALAWVNDPKRRSESGLIRMLGQCNVLQEGYLYAVQVYADVHSHDMEIIYKEQLLVTYDGKLKPPKQ
jgi:hypothetical protein